MGMRCHVHAFDARVGGKFRISLTHDASTGVGKTTARTDGWTDRRLPGTALQKHAYADPLGIPPKKRPQLFPRSGRSFSMTNYRLLCLYSPELGTDYFDRCKQSITREFEARN